MNNGKVKKKTVLVAFSDPLDALSQCKASLSESCRLLGADGVLSLIDSLERYYVDMLIVDAELPGISMSDLLPFLRGRYGEIKVVVVMRDYSAEVELSLRPHKILYVLTWPPDPELLQSLVEKGLSIEREKSVPA